jgi:tRNA uridine 5-carboxymethylaminomethyl modification enzyme
MEGRPLPEGIDYAAVPGLSIEAVQKLQTVRPVSLGQAQRVSGVSPADIAALMIWLESPASRRNADTLSPPVLPPKDRPFDREDAQER